MKCEKPCEGCAFTPGAEANREPQNNLRAQLCLLGGIPFYCHHDDEGNLRDLSDIHPSQRRAEIQAGRLRICAGWRREVAAASAAGYYRTNRDAKRAYAVFGLGALARYLTAKGRREKRRLARVLGDIVIGLSRERGFTEIVRPKR